MHKGPASDGDKGEPRAGVSGLAYRNGSLAMMAALVLASLAALALRAPSPLTAVANAIMDRTPVAIAIPLLLRLGPLAQPLALCGAAALALLAGGLLGRLYGCPPVLPRALLATAILVVLLTVVAPDGDRAVLSVLLLSYLTGLHLLGYRPPPAEGRRQFLAHNARIVGGFAALVALLYLQPVAHLLRTRVAGRALFPWTPRGPRKPGFDLAGLTPEVTPAGHFYQMDQDIQRPDIDPDGWALSIEGLVRRPARLSLADLLALPRHDAWVTQRCVSNPVDGQWMSTAQFSGLIIPALLAHAGGYIPGASAVLFGAADGHEESIPLSLALDGSVMLAYAMDGRLLEQAHGFPARALIPGYYGYKSVKWVTTLRVTTSPGQGFWEQRGWAALPEVRTVARIDVARREGGGLVVAGVAFAGRRGVRAVQARVDDGPWRAAALHTPTLSPLTWTQWRLTLPRRLLPSRGSFTVQARAIDGRGVAQTAATHDQYPSGATGYHTVVVSSL